MLRPDELRPHSPLLYVACIAVVSFLATFVFVAGFASLVEGR